MLSCVTGIDFCVKTSGSLRNVSLSNAATSMPDIL
uniref:Uncharacterized protein n=1 Tax=Anguilla anguilla TaxID=7936 RepID=A0A0E9T990_ANGAN